MSYFLKTLETTIKLDFLNFSDESFTGDFLAPKEGREEEIDIKFFKDADGAIVEKLKKITPRGSIIKMHRWGKYCKIFDIARRRTFCFFTEGVPMDYLAPRAVDDSFLMFQDALDIMFLHSASIVINGNAYLFIAPSGGGKSTIAELARDKGLQVLEDESCIVKRKGDRFFTGSFPSGFPPASMQEVAGIFFLNKADRNKAVKFSATEALRKALPEATSIYSVHIPDDRKTDYRRYVFNFISSMLDNVNFKLLDFTAQPEVFSCLV
ncbi:MAG: hypothetical protein HQ594_00580 [Candidatus Omnitrophica bacterium]|nr:hypothetical protein [Candidatus Omnitrophota bacterium]